MWDLRSQFLVQFGNGVQDAGACGLGEGLKFNSGLQVLWLVSPLLLFLWLLILNRPKVFWNFCLCIFCACYMIKAKLAFRITTKFETRVLLVLARGWHSTPTCKSCIL
jgi:hypothetical protein